MQFFLHFRHRLQRHFRIAPALPVLLFYLSGLLGPIFRLGLFLHCLFAFFCILLVLSGLRQRYIYYSPIFFVGLLWGHVCHYSPWQTYLPILPRAECQATIQARVISNPSISSHAGTQSQGRFFRRETIAIQGLLLEGQWQRCSGKVLLQFDPSASSSFAHLPHLRHGDSFVLQGVFLQPASFLEADFPHRSWRRHLRSLGIQRLFLAQSELNYLPAANWHRWRQKFLQSRHYLGSLLADGISRSEHASLYQTMLLGGQGNMPHELRTRFVRSATIHIFSISGLHVSSIIALALLLLRSLTVPFRRRWFLLIPLLGVYIFLTGCAPSAVRSFWMSFSVALAIVRFRPAAAHNSLSFSGLFLLLYNPYYLLHLGFLYSFTLVAVLLYGWPLLSRVTSIIHERNLWLPPAQQRRWLQFLSHWLTAAFCTSCLAWLGSVGLNLYCNGLCTFGSVLINILLIPITGGLIFLAFPKCVAAIFWPSLSRCLGQLISYLFQLLIILADIGSQPFSTYFFRQPTLGWLILFYFLLLLFFVFSDVRLRLSLGISLLFCFISATWLTQKSTKPRLWLCLGNDGTAPAICLQKPSEKSLLLLYPGGRSSALTMSQALASRGFQQIGRMYLPVHNASTAGALVAIYRPRPEAIVLPPRPACQARAMTRLITFANAQGINHSYLQNAPQQMLSHQDSQNQYVLPEKKANKHNYLIFDYQDLQHKIQVTMKQTMPGKYLLIWKYDKNQESLTVETAKLPLVTEIKMTDKGK